MPTLAEAQQKWEEKTANAGAKWESKKSDATTNFGNSSKYQQLGVSPGPMTQAAYGRGLARVSGASFQASIAGKGQKWASNFREGFAR